MIAVMLASCTTDKVYDTYIHTETEGWEKNEDIVFNIDSLKEGGTYSLILGVRLSDTYPFKNLHMVVDQTIYPGQQHLQDTVTCHVASRNGTMLGHGVSLYQYDMPLRRHTYHQGDSISIKVRHNMKREILPGIADVGIILKNNNRIK